MYERLHQIEVYSVFKESRRATSRQAARAIVLVDGLYARAAFADRGRRGDEVRAPTSKYVTSPVIGPMYPHSPDSIEHIEAPFTMTNEDLFEHATGYPLPRP